MVPIAPKLVNVRCEGERGSGPKRAKDLCWVSILALRLRYKTQSWDLSYEAGTLAMRL